MTPTIEDFNRITRTMRNLEHEITGQVGYILRHGDENDRNTDEQWEQYKRDHEYNLRKWDAMKQIRDEYKRLLNL